MSKKRKRSQESGLNKLVNSSENFLMKLTFQILIVLEKGDRSSCIQKRIVSKAALTKARMKLKFKAFVELNLHLVHYFEKHFKLRLIRIENNESVAVLATSLIDTQQYPIDIFNDLYHDRWPIEEDYKAIKCRMELENFSGKSALSIYQDFHAKVFAKNLVWMMAFSVQDRIDQDSCVKKHRYQINFTQAFSKSKGVIALLFHDASSRSMHLIADLQSIFQRTVEPVRPGRKYPRNHKARPIKFFPQYKPIG